MKVWIARDEDGEVNLFTAEPTLDYGGWSVDHEASVYDVWYKAQLEHLEEADYAAFHGIEPGECYEAEITLGEKVK